MQDIIAKAKEFALNEIKQYGTPKSEHFHLANEKWQMLAEKLGADKDIVLLGTILMDLKIGECVKEGKIQEHIARSSQAAQKFLQEFDIASERLKKIISCIESHHGTPKYPCIEAEICANADCYRFLHPRGILSAFILFGRRDESTDNCLVQVEKKMDEKFSILSLPLCKKELTLYYNQFKKLIEEAKSKSWSMKTILVDAGHTFIIRWEGIFKDMYQMLEKYPNRKILLTNANDEEMKKDGLSNLPYELFTLKHNPDKTDPNYYKTMLKHFNLEAKDVICFEHKKDSVISAQSIGINTCYYDSDKKDLVALKKFIDTNL